MSNSVSEDQVTLKDNGDILLDNELIGYLGWNENVLVDMKIKKSHRGRGIGTIAIKKMIDQMIAEDPTIEVITTTTVLSGAMETALKRAGFEEKTVEKPIMSPDNIPDEVDPDSIKTETEIEYEYEV